MDFRSETGVALPNTSHVELNEENLLKRRKDTEDIDVNELILHSLKMEENFVQQKKDSLLQLDYVTNEFSLPPPIPEHCNWRVCCVALLIAREAKQKCGGMRARRFTTAFDGPKLLSFACILIDIAVEHLSSCDLCQNFRWGILRDVIIPIRRVSAIPSDNISCSQVPYLSVEQAGSIRIPGYPIPLCMSVR